MQVIRPEQDRGEKNEDAAGLSKDKVHAFEISLKPIEAGGQLDPTQITSSKATTSIDLVCSEQLHL